MTQATSEECMCIHKTLGYWSYSVWLPSLTSNWSQGKVHMYIFLVDNKPHNFARFLVVIQSIILCVTWCLQNINFWFACGVVIILDIFFYFFCVLLFSMFLFFYVQHWLLVGNHLKYKCKKRKSCLFVSRVHQSFLFGYVFSVLLVLYFSVVWLVGIN